MLKKYFPLLFIILFVSITASAQVIGIPERPSPPRLVNNLSKEMPNFLSSNEEARLEQKLSAFANQTSNQIVIVVVDDLGGDEPWSYATELIQKWGIGQAKMDNGIAILVKPTGTEGQRDLHIAVGYGLEGAIPDLTTKQIREKEMYPYFKKGEYYTALDKATDVLMALAKGEYNSGAYGKKNKTTIPSTVDVPKENWLMVAFIFFVGIVLYRMKASGKYGTKGLTIGGNFSDSSFGGGQIDESSNNFGGFGGGGAGGSGSGGKW